MYLYTFCGSPVRYLILRQVCTVQEQRNSREVFETSSFCPPILFLYTFCFDQITSPTSCWFDFTLTVVCRRWQQNQHPPFWTFPLLSMLARQLRSLDVNRWFFCGHLFHGSEDLGLNLSLSLTAQKISHLRHFKAKHLQSLAAGNCANLTFPGKTVGAAGPKDVGLDVLTSLFTAAFTCCSQLRQIINSLEARRS